MTHLGLLMLCALAGPLGPHAPVPAAGPAPHVGQPKPKPANPGAVSAPLMGVGATTVSSQGGGATGGAVSMDRAATTRGRVNRSVRGTSGRTGTATTPSARAAAAETWELWWQSNRDEFLDLKSRQAAATTVSGSPGHLLGRGRRSTRPRGHRPSLARMDGEVVPALLELLATRDEGEILNSAALAVGRIASPALSPQVRPQLVALLDHHDRNVQASAVLGLGALGSTDADAELLALLRDDSTGRGLTGGGAVDSLPRAISALSLGLLGDARSAWSLMDVVQRLPDAEADVKACAVAALGLMPPDSPRTSIARTVLAELLHDRGLDPEVASVIPTTLAKLGARESVPQLLAVLADRDADRLVRQSAVIALGRLGSLDEGPLVDALVAELRDGRDVIARHFAIMALGRLGAGGSDDADAHLRLRIVLERESSGRGQRTQRGWGALAAALHGRAHEPTRAAVLPGLRKAHADETDPRIRAAYALALGLLQDTASASALRDDLGAGDETLVGFSAVALGLIGDRESLDPVRALLRRNGASSVLRTRASTALALLVDVDSVPELVELLRGDATFDEQLALSKAIGMIGDERAVTPLLELALDDNQTPHARGFACVALGLLGERTSLPFQAALRASTNYLADIDPLKQVTELL